MFTSQHLNTKYLNAEIVFFLNTNFLCIERLPYPTHPAKAVKQNMAICNNCFCEIKQQRTHVRERI